MASEARRLIVEFANVRVFLDADFFEDGDRIDIEDVGGSLLDFEDFEDDRRVWSAAFRVLADERDRLREFVEIVATSVEMYGTDPLWLAEDGKRLGVWFEVSGADDPIRIELPWKREEATDGE